MNRNYQICSRCIMDTTDPDIVFDDNGYCNHCTRAIKIMKRGPYSLSEVKKKESLDALVLKIKQKGKGKRYDCIVGVSGGVDSSYTAFKVKELGLRPLAVHLDNGWDSELAVMNIENICKKLNIDLYTHVIDWEEFKDLQHSFLKASTPDSEIPSDHAIVTQCYQIAEKESLHYILAGTNLSTESILPQAWSQGHDDWKYIRNIQKRFGTKRLKTFPHRTFLIDCYYNNIKRIEWIDFLDYFNYDKDKAKQIIIKELEWRDYGGKHHESNYTKIYQAYILPKKFGFDKRRAHLSSMVVAGQISRENALEKMQEHLYAKDKLEDDLNYLTNKFSISRSDFDNIMASPKKTYGDYPNLRNSFYWPMCRCISIFFKYFWRIIGRGQ
jgi:N-acetyl sugar amidotransferase